MQKTDVPRAATPVRTARKRHGKAALAPRERRRLTQLILCMCLFALVFVGKGIAPAGLAAAGEELLDAIRNDTDFYAAFSSLGKSISQGKPVIETLETLMMEVFGGGTQQETGGYPSGPATQAARTGLAESPTPEKILNQIGAQAQQEPAQEPPLQPAQEPSPSPTPNIPAYDGPELPAGATMSYAELGLGGTATPVMGVVSSGYGYRDHPVDGAYTFHSGADLAVDSGTPILAFADGVVEFIGESEVYGQYVQLDHGNGVTSFYCHCSKLYYPKGAQVEKGKAIAEVGQTGNATGPHLHFELEQDGVLLNPLYYIETLSS